MQAIERIIDINAHIENISCEITISGGMPQAVISFDNLGFGNITAVKFNAKGYNSFGDLIQINGKDKFFLIVQDMYILKNTHASDLIAFLPHGDIRTLELEECQICYDNGTVSTYSKKKNYKFQLNAYTDDEIETVIALRDKFRNNFSIKPESFSVGWFCGCGRFNPSDNTICSLCGNEKSEIFNAVDENTISFIVQEYRNKEVIRKEAEKQAAIKKEKADKIKKIIIGSSVILVIIIIGFLIHAGIMSTRQTYLSESDMKNALQGTWSHRSGGYYDDVIWQIIIKDNKGTTKYNTTDSEYSGDIEWNPSNGTFKYLGTTYTVQRGGNKITGGDYDYSKGGYMSPRSSSKPYESAYTALKISNKSVSSNSSYTACTGTITNNGSKTYKYVKLKGAFKSNSGTVVDTSWTYAVGSEGLSPGESTTFRLSVSKNSSINDCSLSILDYD